MEYTFKDGMKVDRRGNSASPVRIMESVSSNGLTKYLTILWSDETTSCNCNGWIIRRKDKQGRPKPRTCKHCKAAKADPGAMTAVADIDISASVPSSPQLQLGPRKLRKIVMQKKEK